MELERTITVEADTREAEEKLAALSQRANAFSASISTAFRQAVAGGKSFEAVLSSLAMKLATIALDKALAPLSNLFGSFIDSAFKGFGLASGGVVAGGRVTPFARGGVVNGPTLFPLARGIGLMGEAGPEAVLPLARGSDGALGVRTQGGAAVNITFNVAATDAESFRRSEAQVTAMLARAVSRGRRGL